MSVEFEIASDQIDGARDYQEDAYMISQLGDTKSGESCALVVMADGMGGHAAGNVASNMVIATFNKTFQSNFPTEKIAESLSESLNRSNDQISASVKETPALQGMGCTMVSAYLQDNKLYWVSVGDSHLYLIRDKELTKYNADHSYGAYLDNMKQQGVDIDEQTGMSRNMLMSAMTGEEISSIDVSEEPIELKPGDRIMVASDGLDTLGTGAIIQYSSWSDNAKECVYSLLKAVEDANKTNQDNTTLIVIDVKEREKHEEIVISASDTKIQDSGFADVSIPEQSREPRSYKGMIWMVIIILLGGGGFFAWQQGLVEQVEDTVKQAGEKVQDLVKAQMPDKTETAPVTSGVQEIEKKPELIIIETKPKVEIVKKGNAFKDKLKSGGKGPVMIRVAGGEFRMGGTIGADEVPKHTVRIRSFMVSVYEVTYAEYDRFAKATKRNLPDNSGWDRKSHPVNNVSWDDALAYTRWLTKQTGKKYRLLSEAEWEYVARAGTTTPYWWGSSAGSGNAHCFDCKTEFSTAKPAKIGTYRSNRFGLYDTAGNVFEWVHDCFHRNYKDAPTDGSVWQGGDCKVRVVRGGAYRSPSNSMRAENRDKFPSSRGQYNVGIRLARNL
jgi:formylglycine-generating enzyme required for sulfatase activity/serine/threonine protein phosphatase PrpC